MCIFGPDDAPMPTRRDAVQQIVLAAVLACMDDKAALPDRAARSGELDVSVGPAR